MKTISATKSKAGAYKGKSHRASPGKMMGQHEQGLASSGWTVCSGAWRADG